MTTPSKRCAIYTRKSSEEGLEQEFNSLHAQREACEAFIKSQKHEGWQMIKTAYDDGGISGGTMERPGLQQLLADIKNHKVDIIVVYKVDRLTRSLADFAKMVELFDAHNVSFVSVTQQFNTTSSMGRLTLNVLLSFAQFEREVTGERIRDKIAASKMKGMFMGGNVPLGYEVKERKLLIKPKEAEIVRNIYKRYLELGTVQLLQKELLRQDARSSNGKPFKWRGPIYNTLSNPIYTGKIRHKNVLYPGMHEAIIGQELWDKVQQRLNDNRKGLKKISARIEPALLSGKLFDYTGEKLVPVRSQKNGRKYRYYVSQSLALGTKKDATSQWRIPGRETEQIVAQAALSMLSDRSAVTVELQKEGVDAPYLSSIIKDITTEELISSFVDRAEFKPDGIKLTLSLQSLVPATDTKAKITRDIPMVMKRRGVEVKIVIDGNSPAQPDPVLIKAVVYANKWFNEFTSGTVKSIQEIALRDGFDKSYVNRILYLAFLSPKVTDMIVMGDQPSDWSLERLTKGSAHPMIWKKKNH